MRNGGKSEGKMSLGLSESMDTSDKYLMFNTNVTVLQWLVHVETCWHDKSTCQLTFHCPNSPRQKYPLTTGPPTWAITTCSPVFFDLYLYTGITLLALPSNNNSKFSIAKLFSQTLKVPVWWDGGERLNHESGQTNQRRRKINRVLKFNSLFNSPDIYFKNIVNYFLFISTIFMCDT